MINQLHSIFYIRLFKVVKVYFLILACILTISLSSAAIADSDLISSSNIETGSEEAGALTNPGQPAVIEAEQAPVIKNKGNFITNFFDYLEKNKSKSFVVNIVYNILLVLTIILIPLSFYVLFKIVIYPQRLLYILICPYIKIDEVSSGYLWILYMFIALVILSMIASVVGPDNAGYVLIGYLIFCIGLKIYDYIRYFRYKSSSEKN